MRRWIRRLALGAATLWLGGVAWAIVAMRQADHLSIMPSAQVGVPWVAWIVETGFYALHPTAEEIQDFNRRAGADLLVTRGTEPQVRRLMAHYIAAGLDLNRPNLESPLLETALHSATLNDKAWPTRVLLDFGARADVRDAKGRTPLDWARRGQEQFPGDAEEAEKVRLLEAAEQAQGHAAASSPAASAAPQR